MKAVRPSIVGVFLALAALSPPDARADEAPFDPPVGSRWTIHSQTREDDVRAGVTKSSVVTRDADFSVVAKTPQGFRIAYALRAFQADGDPAQTRLSTIALTALRGVVIEATTDASGKPVRVENFPEVQAAFAKAIDGVFASVSQKPDVVAKIRAMIDAIAPRDADKAAESYFEELPLLAAAQNVHLPLGEVRADSEMAPNPFGGSPLKTNRTLRVIDVDNENGARRLLRTSGYDEAGLKIFIQEMLAKLVDAGDAEKMRQMMSQISLSDEERTEFTVEHGMTHAVSQDTMLIVRALGLSATKHQQTEITVTPAEPGSDAK